jgi:hypothetical protein
VKSDDMEPNGRTNFLCFVKENWVHGFFCFAKLSLHITFYGEGFRAPTPMRLEWGEGDTINEQKFVWRSLGKCPLGRLRRWTDNIKMNRRRRCWKDCYHSICFYLKCKWIHFYTCRFPDTVRERSESPTGNNTVSWRSRAKYLFCWSCHGFGCTAR